MVVSYHIIYNNHFDRPVIKATICKINNSLLLPVSSLIKLYQRQFWRKLASVKLKLKN